MIIERQTTYDCAPTLGDDAVLQFTKDGWLSFPAVVAPEVNERCVDFLSTLAAQNAEANGGVNPGHFGPSDVDPVALLGQEWFVDGVLLCPAVIGAVRSLLGACVGLPVLLHNHRVTPENSPAPEQTFHHDGGSQFGEELQYLQVFYYPQDVTAAMGPTELCPGTHWRPRSEPTASPVLTTATAGTVFITDYPIFHRRAASHEHCSRDLLKYMYWRTTPPCRDWVGSEKPFDFARADYNSPHAHAIMGDCLEVARRFMWLCAEPFPERLLGAQGWPLSRPNSVDAPWGSPGVPPPAEAVAAGYQSSSSITSRVVAASPRL